MKPTSVMRHGLRGVRVVAVALCAAALALLSGCASKDSADYLPQGTAYGIFNADEARKSAGLKRLMQFGEKLQGSLGFSQDVSRVDFVVDGVPIPGQSPGVYAAIRGNAGSADKVLTAQKSVGAVPAQVNGLDAVKSQSADALLVRLNESSVLHAASEAALQRMFSSAQGKAPRAVNDAVYQRAAQVSATSPIVFVLKFEDVFKNYSNLLAGAPGPMQQGVSHLKNVKSVIITADWREQLEATITCQTGNNDQAKGLHDFLKGLLLMARMSGANAAVLKDLQIITENENVKITQKASKEQSDAFLAKLEDIESRLPTDPAQRNAFLQQVLMQNFANAAPPRPQRVTRP